MLSSLAVHGVLLGLVLAGPYLVVAEKIKSKVWRHDFLGLGLIGAALVYVGFALMWGSHGERWLLLLEMVGVVLYSSLYGLSKVLSKDWILSVGWLLHPLWDLVLHLDDGIGAHVAPQWYVWACVSFDVAVAAYIAGGLSFGGVSTKTK